MYKILIVDDEELVRTSIANIVNWEALGFSEVYQAENGLQALEMALEYQPDLVLTDIKMPFMDGLELSAKLKEQLPLVQTVVLSGHSEFKFAQEAITHGVLAYILKPLGAESLTKKITEIRQILDSKLQERQYLEKIKNQLDSEAAADLTGLRTNSGKTIVGKVLDYLKNNYQLEKLTLFSAATHASVSAPYLSALFKKETGLNFVDYLTQIRMEKAIELLKTTDLKNYEIAYRVGFSNPHYFSVSF